jgi:hypothetical protein
VHEAGWASELVSTDTENFAPTGIGSTDCSTGSESLYTLRYLGCHVDNGNDFPAELSSIYADSADKHKPCEGRRGSVQRAFGIAVGYIVVILYDPTPTKLFWSMIQLQEQFYSFFWVKTRCRLLSVSRNIDGVYFIVFS